MRLFSDEISPEEAREYGLDDHALTNSIDLKNPILQTMYMEKLMTIQKLLVKCGCDELRLKEKGE